MPHHTQFLTAHSSSPGTARIYRVEFTGSTISLYGQRSSTPRVTLVVTDLQEARTLHAAFGQLVASIEGGEEGPPPPHDLVRWAKYGSTNPPNYEDYILRLDHGAPVPSPAQYQLWWEQAVALAAAAQ